MVQSAKYYALSVSAGNRGGANWAHFVWKHALSRASQIILGSISFSFEENLRECFVLYISSFSIRYCPDPGKI